MNQLTVLAATICLALPATAGAGTLSRLADFDLHEQVARGIGETVDAGVEGALLASAGRDGADAAAEIDLVIGIYGDRRAATRRPSLKQRIVARALGLQAPPAKWPMLSRPRFEAHVGGVFDLGGDRRQLHLAAGSGLGPVGLAVSATREWSDAGAAWAMGPELRIRHRFGPGRRTPSVGLLVRGDVFLEDRAAHPDRVSVGVFGAFDVL
jgi:hypothetical protein